MEKSDEQKKILLENDKFPPNKSKGLKGKAEKFHFC